MILLIVAYLAGILTILSPCVLPVLPFVFAKANGAFVRNGLPLLVGMGGTFTAVALLASVGGNWAVQANAYGRGVALVVLAFFGLTLISERLATWLTGPLVRLGGRISNHAGAGDTVGSSLLLGVATGLLWAPCAGPVLGIILTGAALQGASAATVGLLLAYAAGAATSLALALVVGGKVFKAMKRGLGAGEWVRRGLGVAVLAGVVAIALGADTGVLAKLSLTNTSRWEQALLERGMGHMPQESALLAGGVLPDEGPMPDLTGAVQWLNSKPLTAEELRGKVVLVDFWTYSCINCLRTLPYVKAWAEKYKDDGLVVIGVHTPEFAFEKVPANVEKAVRDLGIAYPVALDNNYAIWQRFNNRYWPAHYFVDGKGRVRHHHFGEGEYAQSENVIRQLLKENGAVLDKTMADVTATGVQAGADNRALNSPETYIGYNRAEGFAGTQVADEAHVYPPAPKNLTLNQWTLSGPWTVGGEKAEGAAGSSITYRFHARDVHLVLGPAAEGTPVSFTVTLDGQPLNDDHGLDTDTAGRGTVQGQRLYQLVRQKGLVRDRTLTIHFDGPVQAFAFTFG